MYKGGSYDMIGSEFSQGETAPFPMQLSASASRPDKNCGASFTSTDKSLAC